MEIGRCPSCQEPYTPSQVAGYGVLRTRPAREGGPTVEYRCARCDERIVLVPHGEGRYAPPGRTPPPPAPPSERVPPWARADAPDPASPPAAAAPPPPPPPPPPPRAREAPGRPPPPATADPGPVTLLEAFDLLGVGPTADRAAVDRAFRERSLQCHPDKVAHLDAEFQALADRKFRRLREAYDLLRGLA